MKKCEYISLFMMSNLFAGRSTVRSNNIKIKQNYLVAALTLIVVHSKGKSYAYQLHLSCAHV